MFSSWYTIVLVALVAAGILLVLYWKNQAGAGKVRPAPEPVGDRNYAQDREDARLAHMSVEDRAWETASLQRQQANSEQRDTLAERRT